MNDLYSRQLNVIGKNNMKKILNLKILIIGSDIIGQECIKSLALMGIGHIYIYDNTLYDKHKHYSRIICRKDQNFKKTPLSCISKNLIHILNSNVNVKIISSDEQVSVLIETNEIDCVIQTNIRSFYTIEQKCMEFKIPYILGINNGFLGYIFTNFNKWSYKIDDENRVKSYIERVNVSDDTINLIVSSNTDLVSKQIILKHKNKKLILDIVSTHLHNKELKISLATTPELLELLKNSNVFLEEVNDTYTVSHSAHRKIVELKNYHYINCNTSFKKNDTLYAEYMGFIVGKNSIKYKTILFHPLCSIIGGILASEVIKLTGKHKPLSQEIVFDYSIFDNNNKYVHKNKQFHDIYELFDKNLIKIIKKQKITMTGCGALGCEISKNLGMMGFCSSKKGLLHITDMDTIELSNLSRQFLFNSGDINKLKSMVIQEKLALYTPNTHIKARALKACDTTEHIFNTSFWKDNDIYINALDNIEARQYIDRKAVLYHKPLFESGTLGNKGNTQVIIPNETATYSEIIDIPTKSIPMCTIRNFPNNINHCIEWSLNIFDKIFTQSFADYGKFSSDKETFIAEILKIDNNTILYERLYNLVLITTCINNYTMESIINYGLEIYKYYYYTPIGELLKTFPEDMKTSDNTLFWSGNKIKPTLHDTNLLKNDYFNKLCELFNMVLTEKVSFIEYNYDTLQALFDTKMSVKVMGRNIVVNKKDNKLSVSTDRNSIDVLLHTLKSINPNKVSLNHSTYDKDIQEHLNILMYFTNLRAKIYSIQESEQIDIKLISGRIIPALASTTSVISGFVVIDILKYLIKQLNYRKVKYSEININLAENIFTVFSAAHPKNVYNNMLHTEYGVNIKTIPAHFSNWSAIRINKKRDKINTLTTLLKELSKTHNIQPDLLIYKKFIIYNKTDRLPLYSIFEEIYSKFGLQENAILVLNIINFNDEGIPILSPPIHYTF
tara:strand:- start:8124 stop:10988 length:2865 start_codon:yes stop_codon:yes gene_type:complete